MRPAAGHGKREWSPTGMPTQAIDQSQFAKRSEPVNKPAERPHGERKFGGGKPGNGQKSGAPHRGKSSSGHAAPRKQGGGGGNWMHDIGRNQG